MQPKNLNMIEKTFLFLWPFIILFSIVAFLISGSKDIVVSFLLGAFTSMLMNSFHYRTLKNAFANNQAMIKKAHVYVYILKMVLYTIVLYFSIRNPQWNVFLTFVGILSYRIVLFPVSLIMLRKENKEGNPHA